MARSLSLLALGATLLFAPMAWAAGQATPDEAKAMAVKAAEYLKSVGPDKAFPEFSAKDGPWHDRDVYVTVLDSKGVMVAHGTNPGLIGKSMIDLEGRGRESVQPGHPRSHGHRLGQLQMAEPCDQGGRGEGTVQLHTRR